MRSHSRNRPDPGSALITALAAIVLAALGAACVHAQVGRTAAAARGSATAKAGFRAEDQIRYKLNAWRTDEDARAWLGFMGSKPEEIISVTAARPHGEKADILVTIKTAGEVRKEGISVKLVSGSQGFNQIDKRWLSQYTKMWKIPADVASGLRLFVGEVKPGRPSRQPDRMFLNELDAETKGKIIEFFTVNKEEIVSDLFRGEGEFRAGWMMVALKSFPQPRWFLRSIDHAIMFYSEGPVEITRQGNLKIGRITMQRKGGDGARETAKMLQFKIDPASLFNAG